MANLEDTINQAISDFDEIENAIEEMGIDVPVGTDTKEYGNLIRKIPSGGITVDQSYNGESENPQSGIAVAEALKTLPIKYVVSPDENGNTVYLRDLESGTYVLQGSFKPNAVKNNVCRFSSNLLVNVVKGTLNDVPTSHIQIFYPVHNVVQFLDITDETYTRKDVKLNDLALQSELLKLQSDLDLFKSDCDGRQNDTDADFDMVFDRLDEIEGVSLPNTANALKATASGEVIRVDDVSPTMHTAKVKVSGKNLITPFTKDYSKEYGSVTQSCEANGQTITLNGIADAGGGRNAFSGYGGTMFLEAGKTYTLSQILVSGEVTGQYSVHITRTADGYSILYVNNTTTEKTITVEKDMNCHIGINAEIGGIYTNAVVAFQVEEGDTATEYEPYIDPGTVMLEVSGKNVFQNIATTKTLNGITCTVNEDGSVTCNGTVEKTSFFALGNIYPIIGATYRLSGSPSGSGFDTYILYIHNNTSGVDIYDMGQGKTFTGQEGAQNLVIAMYAGTTVNNLTFYPMVVVGEESGDYEPYKMGGVFSGASGNFKFYSLSPTMTLSTDTDGAIIELEYNQDANVALDNVRQDLVEADNMLAELSEDMGDVETALDGIIAIQNELLGVSE